MTPDGLDHLIRNHFPAPDIPSHQVERVMAGVLARLDHPRPMPWWRLWLDILGENTPSLPALLRQSAVPVGVAVALGIYAGQALQPAIQPQSLANLVASNSILMTGY